MSRQIQIPPRERQVDEFEGASYGGERDVILVRERHFDRFYPAIHPTIESDGRAIFDRPSEYAFYNEQSERLYNEPRERFYNEQSERFYNEQSEIFYNEQSERFYNEQSERFYNEQSERVERPWERHFPGPMSAPHSYPAPRRYAPPRISPYPPPHRFAAPGTVRPWFNPPYRSVPRRRHHLDDIFLPNHDDDTYGNRESNRLAHINPRNLVTVNRMPNAISKPTPINEKCDSKKADEEKHESIAHMKCENESASALAKNSVENKEILTNKSQSDKNNDENRTPDKSVLKSIVKQPNKTDIEMDTKHWPVPEATQELLKDKGKSDIASASANPSKEISKNGIDLLVKPQSITSMKKDELVVKEDKKSRKTARKEITFGESCTGDKKNERAKSDTKAKNDQKDRHVSNSESKTRNEKSDIPSASANPSKEISKNGIDLLVKPQSISSTKEHAVVVKEDKKSRKIALKEITCGESGTADKKNERAKSDTKARNDRNVSNSEPKPRNEKIASGILKVRDKKLTSCVKDTCSARGQDDICKGASSTPDTPKDIVGIPMKSRECVKPQSERINSKPTKTSIDNKDERKLKSLKDEVKPSEFNNNKHVSAKKTDESVEITGKSTPDITPTKEEDDDIVKELEELIYNTTDSITTLPSMRKEELSKPGMKSQETSPQAFKKDIKIKLINLPLAKDSSNQAANISSESIKDAGQVSKPIVAKAPLAPKNSTIPQIFKNTNGGRGKSRDSPILEEIFILEDALNDIDNGADKMQGSSSSLINSSYSNMVPITSEAHENLDVQIIEPECEPIEIDDDSVDSPFKREVPTSMEIIKIESPENEEDNLMNPTNIEVAQSLGVTQQFENLGSVDTRMTYLYCFKRIFDDPRIVDMDVSNSPSPSNELDGSIRSEQRETEKSLNALLTGNETENSKIVADGSRVLGPNNSGHNSSQICCKTDTESDKETVPPRKQDHLILKGNSTTFEESVSSSLGNKNKIPERNSTFEDNFSSSLENKNKVSEGNSTFEESLASSLGNKNKIPEGNSTFEDNFSSSLENTNKVSEGDSTFEENISSNLGNKNTNDNYTYTPDALQQIDVQTIEGNYQSPRTTGCRHRSKSFCGLNNFTANTMFIRRTKSLNDVSSTTSLDFQLNSRKRFEGAGQSDEWVTLDDVEYSNTSKLSDYKDELLSLLSSGCDNEIIVQHFTEESIKRPAEGADMLIVNNEGDGAPPTEERPAEDVNMLIVNNENNVDSNANDKDEKDKSTKIRGKKRKRSVSSNVDNNPKKSAVSAKGHEKKCEKAKKERKSKCKSQDIQKKESIKKGAKTSSHSELNSPSTSQVQEKSSTSKEKYVTKAEYIKTFGRMKSPVNISLSIESQPKSNKLKQRRATFTCEDDHDTIVKRDDDKKFKEKFLYLFGSSSEDEEESTQKSKQNSKPRDNKKEKSKKVEKNSYQRSNSIQDLQSSGNRSLAKARPKKLDKLCRSSSLDKPISSKHKQDNCYEPKAKRQKTKESRKIITDKSVDKEAKAKLVVSNEIEPIDSRIREENGKFHQNEEVASKSRQKNTKCSISVKEATGAPELSVEKNIHNRRHSVSSNDSSKSGHSYKKKKRTEEPGSEKLTLKCSTQKVPSCDKNAKRAKTEKCEKTDHVQGNATKKPVDAAINTKETKISKKQVTSKIKEKSKEPKSNESSTSPTTSSGHKYKRIKDSSDTRLKKNIGIDRRKSAPGVLDGSPKTSLITHENKNASLECGATANKINAPVLNESPKPSLIIHENKKVSLVCRTAESEINAPGVSNGAPKPSLTIHENKKVSLVCRTAENEINAPGVSNGAAKPSLIIHENKKVSLVCRTAENEIHAPGVPNGSPKPSLIIHENKKVSLVCRTAESEINAPGVSNGAPKPSLTIHENKKVSLVCRTAENEINAPGVSNGAAKPSLIIHENKKVSLVCRTAENEIHAPGVPNGSPKPSLIIHENKKVSLVCRTADNEINAPGVPNGSPKPSLTIHEIKNVPFVCRATENEIINESFEDCHPFSTMKTCSKKIFVVTTVNNDCVDTVYVSDAVEVKNDSIVIQQNLEKDDDDVIEIVSPVPMIDLTDDCDDSPKEILADVLLEAKKEIQEMPQENSFVTLYRSEENASNTDDVQAVSESFVLNLSSKKCDTKTISSMSSEISSEKEKSASVMNANVLEQTSAAPAKDTSELCTEQPQAGNESPTENINIASLDIENQNTVSALLELLQNQHDESSPALQSVSPNNVNLDSQNISSINNVSDVEKNVSTSNVLNINAPQIGNTATNQECSSSSQIANSSLSNQPTCLTKPSNDIDNQDSRSLDAPSELEQSTRIPVDNPSSITPPNLARTHILTEPISIERQSTALQTLPQQRSIRPNQSAPPSLIIMNPASKTNNSQNEIHNPSVSTNSDATIDLTDESFELSTVDLRLIVEILTRHTYFLAHICHAQRGYVQTLSQKPFYKNYFKAEIALFEEQKKSRLLSESLQVWKELQVLNIRASRNLSDAASLIVDYVTVNLENKDIQKRVTKSITYLLLGELIRPQVELFIKIPLFKTLIRHIGIVSERVRSRFSGSLFTPEMRRILEEQVNAYNRLCTQPSSYHNQSTIMSTANTNNQENAVEGSYLNSRTIDNITGPNIGSQHLNNTNRVSPIINADGVSGSDSNLSALPLDSRQTNLLNSTASSGGAESIRNNLNMYNAPNVSEPGYQINQNAVTTSSQNLPTSNIPISHQQTLMSPPAERPRLTFRVPPGTPSRTMAHQQPLSNANVSSQPQHEFARPKLPIPNVRDKILNQPVSQRNLPGGANTKRLGCTPRYIPNYDAASQNHIYAPYSRPGIQPMINSFRNQEAQRGQSLDLSSSLRNARPLVPAHSRSSHNSTAFPHNSNIMPAVERLPPSYEEAVSLIVNSPRDKSPTQSIPTENTRSRSESLLCELLSSTTNSGLFTKPTTPVNDNFMIKLPFTKPSTSPTTTSTSTSPKLSTSTNKNSTLPTPAISALQTTITRVTERRPQNVNNQTSPTMQTMVVQGQSTGLQTGASILKNPISDLIVFVTESSTNPVINWNRQYAISPQTSSSNSQIQTSLVNSTTSASSVYVIAQPETSTVLNQGLTALSSIGQSSTMLRSSASLVQNHQKLPLPRLKVTANQSKPGKAKQKGKPKFRVVSAKTDQKKRSRPAKVQKATKSRRKKKQPLVIETLEISSDEEIIAQADETPNSIEVPCATNNAEDGSHRLHLNQIDEDQSALPRTQPSEDLQRLDREYQDTDNPSSLASSSSREMAETPEYPSRRDNDSEVHIVDNQELNKCRDKGDSPSVIPTASPSPIRNGAEQSSQTVNKQKPDVLEQALEGIIKSCLSRPSTISEACPSAGEDDIETIDLTWIDDMDETELQEEMDFVFVKQEIVDSPDEQVNREVPSPADSGIDCSPSQNDEGATYTLVRSLCLCGEIANYNCACGDAWYCGQQCQLKDWVFHQRVCHIPQDSAEDG